MLLIASVDFSHFGGEAVFILDDQRGQYVHIAGLCAAFCFTQKELGRFTDPALYHAQAFGLHAVGAHCAEHIGQAFGALTQDEPSAEAEQPLRRRADIIERTFRFMQGDLLRAVGADDPRAAELIRRVADDEIALTRGHACVHFFDISQNRLNERRALDPVLRVAANTVLQQVDRLGLDINGGDVTRRGIADQQERDRTAAGAELNDPVAVFRRGKMRQKDRIGGKMMGVGDIDRHPAAQRLQAHLNHPF